MTGLGIGAAPLLAHPAIEPGDDVRVGLEHIDGQAACRREVFAAACQASPAILGCEHQERVERDDHERERAIERERPHVGLREREPEALLLRALRGAREHPGGAIDARDLDPVLRQRDRDAAGADAELEDRAAGHAGEAAEPVDRGVVEARVEVVERGETGVVGVRSRRAEPVNDGSHRRPPSRGAAAPDR